MSTYGKGGGVTDIFNPFPQIPFEFVSCGFFFSEKGPETEGLWLMLRFSSVGGGTTGSAE